MAAPYVVEQVAVAVAAAASACSEDIARHHVVTVVVSLILLRMERDLLMPEMSARKRTEKDMLQRLS